MKSYLRYEPSISCGIIAAANCGLERASGESEVIFSGALREINKWNIRQGSQIACLRPPKIGLTNEGDVTVLRSSNNPHVALLAAGYSNGDIIVFNSSSHEVFASLRGHRAAITSLTFDEEGSYLVSGSADCDIIVWDAVEFVGKCRLRGHKDAVTGVGIFKRSNSNTSYIVSVSKDTLMKVWDISTQFCVQTIVGHRSEIWSLTMVVLEANDLDSLRIWTGSSDEWLRGFRISTDSDSASSLNDEEQILVSYGRIKRSDRDRVSNLIIDIPTRIIGIQTTGKVVELIKIRDAANAKKKLKRRLKRIREKQHGDVTKATTSYSAWNDNDIDAGTSDELVDVKNLEDLIVSDELDVFSSIRCVNSKVRGLLFLPSGVSKVQVLISLANNSLEIHSVSFASESSEVLKTNVIELQGHRSDVRGVSISSDGLLVASCSVDGIKLWNSKNLSCIRSCKSEDVLSISFLPGAKYIVAGTKLGRIQVFDTLSGDLLHDELAHSGAVNEINVRPDGRGFMSVSSDKLVKFWDFIVTSQDSFRSGGQLGLELSRELQMSHDALCCRYSPTKSSDKLLLAVGLLDHTVKVFYDDSLKFFLSLYGHKLPVTCLDFSSDCRLLASGSADKTVKIWGMDFGDCHRSLFAHSDSVTSLKFQSDTHYFFSSGKDGVIKYWDADRFEQIMSLPGHVGVCWSLALADDASVIISCGGDKSIRLWERTDEMVFVEEEREREIEKEVESSIQQQNFQDAETTMVTLQSTETVRGGEGLMESLDLVENEIAEIIAWQQSNVSNKKPRQVNVRLLGLSPLAYLLRSFKSIKPSDLEASLIVLPFAYVTRLISHLLLIAKKGIELELCARCCILLLQIHQRQVLTSRSSVVLKEMNELRQILLESVNSYRLLIGTNLAGLRSLRQRAEDQRSSFLSPVEVEEIKLVNKKRKNKNETVRKRKTK